MARRSMVTNAAQPDPDGGMTSDHREPPMRTAIVHLHSTHNHPAHGHAVTVDADAEGVPVEHVSIVVVGGVPIARLKHDPRSQRLVEGQERALFVRGAPGPDGVWVFVDSDVRMGAAPSLPRPPDDPQMRPT